MRIRQKHLTVIMSSGLIALIATISATLSADQSPAPAPSQTPAAIQTAAPVQTPASAQRAATAATPAAPVTPARELVSTYCVSCHNERVHTANLMLDKADTEQVANSADTWEKVIVKLRSRAMPPP